MFPKRTGTVLVCSCCTHFKGTLKVQLVFSFVWGGGDGCGPESQNQAQWLPLKVFLLDVFLVTQDNKGFFTCAESSLLEIRDILCSPSSSLVSFGRCRGSMFFDLFCWFRLIPCPTGVPHFSPYGFWAVGENLRIPKVPFLGWEGHPTVFF